MTTTFKAFRHRLRTICSHQQVKLYSSRSVTYHQKKVSGSSCAVSDCRSATVATSGDSLQIAWPNNDKEVSVFHASWLWLNDPANIHPSSGQRLRTLAQFSPKEWKIEACRIDTSTHFDNLPSMPGRGSFHSLGGVYDTINKVTQGGDPLVLEVQWRHAISRQISKSFFYVDWLEEFRYDNEQQSKQHGRNEVTPAKAIGAIDDTSTQTMKHWEYEDLVCSKNQYHSDQLMQMLHAILCDGAVLVRNAPRHASQTDSTSESATVARLGQALTAGGMLSHGALYGDIFHVKVEPNANNIAYTTHALPPHQDLAYFESKPFLQLLHCKDNIHVVGGDSTLIDAMAAAHELSRIAPEHFDTLSTWHATFLKQRLGAQMTRFAPHIQLQRSSITGREIVSVNWSPPFEGPLLKVPPDTLHKYQEAYAAFSQMLDSGMEPSSSGTRNVFQEYAHTYTWQYTLQEGEILIFNNQRMLHGRRGFELSDPSRSCRHLVGCYTSVDETLSRYHVLCREAGVDALSYPNVGNGTFSH